VKAKIHVTLKRGVLDPQGKAIRASLSHLGIDGVEECSASESSWRSR